MTKVLRRNMVDELTRKFEGVENLVLVDFRKLTANQTVELRAQMLGQDVRMNVLKNSVAKHTFKKIGQEFLNEHLRDMNAVVYGPDPLAIAKVIHEYRGKNNQLPEVKAAVVDGKAVGPEHVEALSKLPSKEEMLGMFVGTMAAPLTYFVRAIAEVQGKFVRVLAAVRDQKEKT